MRQPGLAGGFAPVIGGVAIAVQRRGDQRVEGFDAVERLQRCPVVQAGKSIQLGQRLAFQRGQKVGGIDAGKAAIQRGARRRQVERCGNRRRRVQHFRRCGALFAQPFQQRVAAQRYAGGEQRRGVVLPQSAQDVADFGAVAGVIGARQAVRFAGTAAKMRHDAAPATLPQRGHQMQGVNTARVALQAMEQHRQRRLGGAVEPIQVDEVAIGHFPALAPVGDRWSSQRRRIEGLRMAAGQPDRGAIGRNGVGHSWRIHG